MKACRVCGSPSRPTTTGTAWTPRSATALEAALGIFAKLGVGVARRKVPFHEELRGLGNIVISAEFCTLHDDWLRNRHDEYAPLVRARMKQGYAFTAVEYLKAVQVRPRITKAFVDDVFGNCGCPVSAGLAFPGAENRTMSMCAMARHMNEVLGSINHCTWPINYLGLPGLSVPAGFSRSGLPIGFQLVGRPFAKRMLLRIASAYERETGWPDRTPTAVRSEGAMAGIDHSAREDGFTAPLGAVGCGKQPTAQAPVPSAQLS